jgi:hypothetical protein
MLQKTPDARPPTAGAAIAALALAAEKAGHVIPPGMPRMARPPQSPNGAAAGDGSVGLAPTDWASGQQARTSQRQRLPRLAWAKWLALLVAAAGLSVYLIAGRLRATPNAHRAGVEPAVATTPATPAVSPPAAAAPASLPAMVAAPPRSVEVTLRGLPRGARVLLDDQPLGEAPGPVSVPFGESQRQLTVTAPGHEPTTVSLVPNRASTMTLKLKRRAAAVTSPRAAIPKDLENPF